MTRLRTIAVWGVLVSAYCCTTTFAQVNSTWNGTTGNWNQANRWSTNPQFPNNGNGGVNYNANIGSGSVTLNQNITIEDLNFTGGTITGTNSLTVQDTLSWTAGTFSGTGTTTVNNGTISSFSAKNLNQRTLEIVGDVDLLEGPINSTSKGTIAIRDGASFDMTGSHIGVREVHANFAVDEGGVLSSSGYQYTSLLGHVDNNGTVEVGQNSFLTITSGSGNGDIIVHQNAALVFELQNASDYQFTGRIILDGGIFDILVFTGSGIEFLIPTYLSGNGVFNAYGGTLIVDGTISPGFSIGHIDIDGNVEFTESATAEMEITSTSSFDTIEVTGDVTLGGTLSLSLLNGGSIQPGDMFDIITADSILGTEFDEVLIDGTEDLLLFPVYESDRVAALAADEGDLNPFIPGVGDDDIAAFALALTNPNSYRSQFGISAKSAGDIDDDGDCDVDDVDNFADLLGITLSQLTYQMQLALAVPEPSSVWLLFGCSFLFKNMTRYRRCRS